MDAEAPRTNPGRFVLRLALVALPALVLGPAALPPLPVTTLTVRDGRRVVRLVRVRDLAGDRGGVGEGCLAPAPGGPGRFRLL